MGKSLEFLLKGAAAALISLGLVEITKAFELSMFKEGYPRIITFDSPEEIRKATVSGKAIAWEQQNNIWYCTWTDPNTQHQLTESNDAHNPDLDEYNLAYDEEGIKVFNLDTSQTKTIYLNSSTEICSQPKIKETHLIFRVDKISATESWDEIWECDYTERRPRMNLLTNSRNPKQSHDTNGRYVVWAELRNKENSLPGLAGGDWDVMVYDLETHKPSVYDPNSGKEIFTLDGGLTSSVTGDPDFSSDSCALNDIYAVYNMNTYDSNDSTKTVGDIDTFLAVYYFENGRRRITEPGIHGAMYELDLDEDVFTWRREYCPGSNPPNEPDRIEYIIIKDERSPGYRLYDSGGSQSRPNAYMDPNGTIAMIVYVSTDSNTPQDRELILTSSSKEYGAIEESKVLGKADTLLSSSLRIVSTPEQMLNPFFDGWLKKYSPPDYNKDYTNNFKDFAILANKWKKYREEK